MEDARRLAVAASAARLRALAGGDLPPLALLLGTGWGGVLERMEALHGLDYRELPAFPVPGVGGHVGRLCLGRLAGREVVVLAGREHAYEHGRCDGMTGAIRALAAAGCRVLLQTNAAGSLDPARGPGTVMLVSDHLNLVQRSPLVGDAGNGNARFVHMGDAYDARLRDQAGQAARAAGLALPEGVYAWVLGPQFETPAEIRMLQRLGAQTVGMSTVPETIAARHAGMRVLALSLLTNLGCGLADEVLSHALTLERAAAAGDAAVRLLQAVVPALQVD